MLQTCQTTKATSSAGTAIHRLRVATFFPVDCQKDGSSGVQSVMGRPGRYCAGSGACVRPVAERASCVAILMACPGWWGRGPKES